MPIIRTSQRAAFARALTSYRALAEENEQDRHDTAREVCIAAEELTRALGRRVPPHPTQPDYYHDDERSRRRDAWEACASKMYNALPAADRWMGDLALKPLIAARDVRMEARHSERRWLSHVMDVTARRAIARPGDAWFTFRTRRPYDYSSQPAAESYAKGSAEQIAHELSATNPGVEVRVRREERKRPSHIAARTVTDVSYHVEVRVESGVDVEIMRRKPGLGLKAWLEDCWRRGLNPRVFSPMLPHDLERRLGVRYWGNPDGKVHT